LEGRKGAWPERKERALEGRTAGLRPERGKSQLKGRTVLCFRKGHREGLYRRRVASRRSGPGHAALALKEGLLYFAQREGYRKYIVAKGDAHRRRTLSKGGGNGPNILPKERRLCRCSPSKSARKGNREGGVSASSRERRVGERRNRQDIALGDKKKIPCCIVAKEDAGKGRRLSASEGKVAERAGKKVAGLKKRIRLAEKRRKGAGRSAGEPTREPDAIGALERKKKVGVLSEPKKTNRAGGGRAGTRKRTLALRTGSKRIL